MMLEGDILKRADPSRGRLRSLLLKAVQTFQADDTIRLVKSDRRNYDDGVPSYAKTRTIPESQDQVMRRSSCACMRQGCVGTTRTLKP